MPPIRSKCKSAKLGLNAFAGAIILSVMLISMVVFVMSVPSDYRERTIPTLRDRPVVSTFIDVSPGEIRSATSDYPLIETSKTISDVKVENIPKDDPFLLASNLLVSRTVISSNPAIFNFSVTDLSSVDSVIFQTYVSDVSGGGFLVVELNGNLVYSAQPEKALDIVLPMNWINEGENKLTLKVTSPGVFFWIRNKYAFGKTYINVQRYYDDVGKVTRTFSLDNSVDYIESAVLNFYVPKQASQKINILLNKEIIYSAQPTGQAAVQIPPYSLVYGTNEIEFTTERGGEYDIYFINLVTGVAPFATAPIRATYSFDITDDDWLKAQNNYYRCTMQLKRVGGSSSVRVKLNSHEKTYFFVDNLIREDVCKYLVRGKNTIMLTSPISLDLSELSVKLTT